MTAAAPTAASPVRWTVPAVSADSGFGQMLRPFLLVAAAAFAVGFVGLLLLSGHSLDELTATSLANPGAIVSTPANSGAASDDWNFPKKI